MAYARGIYGVEYTPQPSRGNEGHPLRWLLLGVVVMVAVALFVAHSRRKPGPPVIVRDAPEAPVVATTDEKPSATVIAPRAMSPEAPPRVEPAPAAKKNRISGSFPAAKSFRMSVFQTSSLVDDLS